jgi:cation:H+ antiporter
MSMEGWPTWLPATVFIASAAVVWTAGTRIAHYADEIAGATGIGRAVIGMLLLGGVTSLPELAVASTASVAGYPALSVNDVLGSAAINVLIIALADAALGRDAITSVLGSPQVLLQGVLGIVLLAVAAAAAVSVPLPFAGASAWTWLMLGIYIAAAWILARSRSAQAWRPEPPAREAKTSGAKPGQLKALVARTILAASVVLVAGYFLTQSGHALAEQSGLGDNFFGAVGLAAATSLPEVSTVFAAVRLKRYEMAVSDIFGTNLFNVVILFVADLLYDGPPVLAEVGVFAAFGALLAIVLTAIFLAGMLERRDRTVLGMGMDSLAAVATYLGGLAVLYQLK